MVDVQQQHSSGDGRDSRHGSWDADWVEVGLYWGLRCHLG